VIEKRLADSRRLLRASLRKDGRIAANRPQLDAAIARSQPVPATPVQTMGGAWLWTISSGC